MKTLHMSWIFSIFLFCSFLPARAVDGPPAEQPLSGCFYIEMFDSFGDGWNGTNYYIYSWQGALAATGTLTTGTYGYEYICLPDGCYTISVGGGSFDSEIFWDLLYTNEGVITGYAPDPGTPFSTGVPIYGCTGWLACNYNASATCDDGTCCYENCTLIAMNDTYGDGWEGGYLEISDNYGNYWFPSINSGTYGQVMYCLDNGCYHVKFIPGYYPEETSFSIYVGGSLAVSGDMDFNQFVGVGGECEYGTCSDPAACDFSAYASYQSGTCCMDNCGIMIMYDIYGDGWSGAQYSITDWNGKEMYHGTLVNYDFGYQVLCLADGCYTMTTTGGSFPAEGSWQIGGDNITNTFGLLPDSQTFTVGIPINGCTDPQAPNFNPAATCNDGSCASPCPADLDGNGVINVSDLLLFTAAFGTYCPS